MGFIFRILIRKTQSASPFAHVFKANNVVNYRIIINITTCPQNFESLGKNVLKRKSHNSALSYRIHTVYVKSINVK